MKRAAALAFVGAVLLACSSDDVSIPVKPAPASRHDALRDALRDDTQAFAFDNGDWLEDLDDAPRFGLAWLSRSGDDVAKRDAAKARALALLDGDPVGVEKVNAALGLVEYIAATGDRAPLAALDGYLDRVAGIAYVDAPLTGEVGPTELTALIALLEVEATRLLGDHRQASAIAHDDAIRAQAFGDLVDASTHGQARAYSFEPDAAGISNTANIAMLVLKARLYRLTKDVTYQIEGRAIYSALQILKFAPGRYSAPDAQATLNTASRDLSLLSDQADLAFAMTLMFEITGEDHFITEADEIFDAIAAMRGPWCSPVTQKCATGLVHHTLDGQLATTLCSGCTFRTLWVLGYRRSLAGETY